MPPLVLLTGNALRWAALWRFPAHGAGRRLDFELPDGSARRADRRYRPRRVGHRPDATTSARSCASCLRGELGAGEAYVAGEWSTPTTWSRVLRDVPAHHRRARAGDRARRSPGLGAAARPGCATGAAANDARRQPSRNVGAHYDLGNELYRRFLDDRHARLLVRLVAAEAGDDARRRRSSAKLDPHLRPRSSIERRAIEVLEIGCGWGGFALHAARTRGCKVTAITISREQYQLASARVAEAGLADRVDIQYRDYRDLDDTRYDKLCSIEMLEAVGYEYLPHYFATCARVLRPGGRFVLQTITIPDARFEAYRRNVDWMQTYIFPGSLIPSVGAIRAAARDFTIASTDDIGFDYVPTLREWRARFLAHCDSGRVHALGFDEVFIRTWLLYLAFSEAAFAERTLANHQLLLVR